MERFQNALNAVESFQEGGTSNLPVAGRAKSVSFAGNPVVQSPQVQSGPSLQSTNVLSPQQMSTTGLAPKAAAPPAASPSSQPLPDTGTVSQRFPSWSIILIAVAIAGVAFVLRKKMSSLYGQFMGKPDPNEIGNQAGTEQNRQMQLLHSMGLSPAQQQYAASNSQTASRARVTPNTNAFMGPGGALMTSPQAAAFAFQQQQQQQAAMQQQQQQQQYVPDFYDAGADDSSEFFDAAALQKAQFAQMMAQKGKGNQPPAGAKGASKGTKGKGKGSKAAGKAVKTQSQPVQQQAAMMQQEDFDEYYPEVGDGADNAGSPEFFSEDQNFLPI